MIRKKKEGELFSSAQNECSASTDMEIVAKLGFSTALTRLLSGKHVTGVGIFYQQG